MQASELMTTDFPILSPQDVLQKAVDIYMDSCVCHVPIVNEGTVEGIFPTDIMMGQTNRKMPISDFKDDWIQAYSLPGQHGMVVFEILARLELTAVPVVDESNKYLGTVLTQDLLYKLSNYYAFKEPGGIIALTLGARDYNLGEISRIVESNNAKILMLYLERDDQLEQLKVTLKLNTTNLTHILATFERYKYQIEYSTPTANERDELRERYDLLMKLFDL